VCRFRAGDSNRMDQRGQGDPARDWVFIQSDQTSVPSGLSAARTNLVIPTGEEIVY
jgi:hypothetical protein